MSAASEGSFEGLHDKLGRFVFGWRDWLAPLCGVVLLVFAKPRPFLGDPALDRWQDALGLLVCALGQALRFAVIGFAYIKRGGTNKEIDAPTLVVQGFYAHSRNPMYFGNFLLLVGLAMLWNSAFVTLLVLSLMLLAIHAIVRAEERFLAGRFGAQYDDYCRRVNRFLPSLGGLSQTMSSMRFEWKRALRKDYGTFFAWTSTAVVFMIVERLHWFGFEASRPAIGKLIAAWFVLLAAWATARWAKKTGRLATVDD
ncbi:MAG: methyltransferase family protein [Alphaproteobacteria bacterium]